MFLFKKKLIFSIIFFLAFTNAFSSEKIVYIDIDYVLSNSNFGQLIYKELEQINKDNIKKLSSKEKIIKEKKANIEKMKNISSNEKLKEDINNFNQEVEKFRLEKDKISKDFKLLKEKKLDNFLTKINPLIQEYMKKNSIDIVLERKQIFIGNSKKDITKDIINLINKN